MNCVAYISQEKIISKQKQKVFVRMRRGKNENKF